MSTLWKVLVGLLLTLPIASYVAGTLVASEADLPGRRAPIVISDSASGPGRTTPPSSPGTGEQTATPRSGGDDRRGAEGDRSDDHGDDRGDDHGVDDDEIELIHPTPDDIDDDEDDDHGGGDDTGDDHGHHESGDDRGGDD
jgi:hypothetical protein